MTKLIMGPERADGKRWFHTACRLRTRTTARAIEASREFIEVRNWCFDNLHKNAWWTVNGGRLNAAGNLSGYVYSEWGLMERELHRADHEFVFIMESRDAAFHFRMRWC